VPRLVGVVLRTGHLFAMAVFVGGIWLGVAAEAVGPWRLLAIGTGLLLLASELTHEARDWPWQGRGLAAIAHVAALGLLGVDGRVATALAVVLGAAGSHAPKAVRKWSLRGGAPEPGAARERRRAP
jgi:hypothetical protein